MDRSSNSNVEYVIMPWDDHTKIVFSGENNEPIVYSRWNLIQKMLNASTKIKSVHDLVKVINSYNNHENESERKFPVLREYFAQLSESERNQFFDEDGLLSSIRNLAFLLRELMPKCEILKTGFSSSIRLHQIQIASILANAFFCTFPKGKADCPSINFKTLFEGQSNSVSQYYVEKIKCIIHYFKRLHEKQPTGTLTFHRHVIPDEKFPRWDKVITKLCSLKVNTEGNIEDQVGYIHMDFSNRYVGGGVLGRGCVQEEIRFVICPELIAARLFTECLADNESVSIVGAERYCSYTGYSNTFKFAGDYVDTTPVDCNGQRRTYLTVIDALYFHQASEQYKESKILRELKKAYVGFKQKEGISNLPMATGNWGCGAFGGNPQLKSLIQIMASSQSRRDMLYLTFGDSDLKNQIENIYQVLKEKNVNIGKLYRIIRLYNRERRKKNQTLFEFILESLQTTERRNSVNFSAPKKSVSSQISNTTENSEENKSGMEMPKNKPQSEEGPSDDSISISNSCGNYTMSDYAKMYGKGNTLENGNPASKVPEFPVENLFSTVWYENECGSNSGSRVRDSERPNESVEHSSSVFSQSDVVETGCEEPKRWSENTKGQEKTNSQKSTQPKITDFFLRNQLV